MSKLQRQIARCVESIGGPVFYQSFANIVDNPDFADLIIDGKIVLPGVAGCDALVAHINALLTDSDVQIVNMLTSVKGIANITPNFIITHTCGAKTYLTYACGSRCCWYHGVNPFHPILENIVAQYAQTDAARRFNVEKFNSTRLFAKNDYEKEGIKSDDPAAYFHFKTHYARPAVDLFQVGAPVEVEPATPAETMITEMAKMIRGIADAEEIVMTVLLMKKDPKYADVNALSPDEFAELLKRVNENTKQLYENDRVRVIDREYKALINHYTNIAKFDAPTKGAYTEDFARNYNMPVIDFPTLEESRNIHIIKRDKPSFKAVVKRGPSIYDTEKKANKHANKKGENKENENANIISPRFAEIVKRNSQPAQE